MAKELRHKDAGIELTRTEDNALDRHYLDGAITNDIPVYDATSTKLVGKTPVELLALMTAALKAELDILSGATISTAELNYLKGVTSAIQTQLDAKVARSLYNANSILKADSLNTPVALDIAASRVIARLATGGIVAATSAEIATLLDKGAANGLASLDASSLVVQKPADRLGVANVEGTAGKLWRFEGAGVNPTEIDVPTGGYTQGAKVKHSAAQSIPDATATIPAFDTEEYDTDTIHDVTTNNSRLTCKTAGKYLCILTSAWASNTTGRRTGDFRVNGTDIISGHSIAPAPTYPINVSATIVDLAVNDYVEARVAQNSGAALNWSTSSRFMMQRVG